MSSTAYDPALTNKLENEPNYIDDHVREKSDTVDEASHHVLNNVECESGLQTVHPGNAVGDLVESEERYTSTCNIILNMKYLNTKFKQFETDSGNVREPSDAIVHYSHDKGHGSSVFHTNLDETLPDSTASLDESNECPVKDEDDSSEQAEPQTRFAREDEEDRERLIHDESDMFRPGGAVEPSRNAVEEERRFLSVAHYEMTTEDSDEAEEDIKEHFYYSLNQETLGDVIETDTEGGRYDELSSMQFPSMDSYMAPIDGPITRCGCQARSSTCGMRRSSSCPIVFKLSVSGHQSCSDHRGFAFIHEKETPALRPPEIFPAEDNATVWQSRILNVCLAMAFLNPLVGLLVVFLVYKAKDCHMQQRPLAARYARVAIAVTLFGILVSAATVSYIVYITNAISDARPVHPSPSSITDITLADVSQPTFVVPSTIIVTSAASDKVSDLRVATADLLELLFQNATIAVHRNKKTGKVYRFQKRKGSL